jgi:hypothetical protein
VLKSPVISKSGVRGRSHLRIIYERERLLPKVLLLAQDEKIKDATIPEQLR